MDAKLVLHVSHFSPRVSRRDMHKPTRYSPSILSVMTKPADSVERLTITKTDYKDNWFDSIAINHLSQSVQSTIGSRLHFHTHIYIHSIIYANHMKITEICSCTCFYHVIGFRSNKNGYEGLVEATTMARQHFSPEKQRELVIQALDKAFPKPILSLASSSLSSSSSYLFSFFPFQVFGLLLYWFIGHCPNFYYNSLIIIIQFLKEFILTISIYRI